MLIPLTLPKRSHPGRFGPDSAGRLVNAYVEAAGEEAKTPAPIYVTDGWTEYAVLEGGSGIRNAIDVDGTLLTVSGRGVFQRMAGGTITNLGTIGGPTTSGMVTMDRNRASAAQTGVTVDGFYYVVQSGVLSAVTANVYSGAPLVSCAVLDGFMVLFFEDGRFQLSTSDDAAAFDLFDVGAAQANADAGIVNITRNRDMLFFSERSIEFWQNTGDTFPFARTAVAQRGTISGRTVKRIGEQVFFIGDDKVVYTLNGYTPARISDHAVERSIAADPRPSTISALVWEDHGHAFYEISGDGFTWTFDTVTGLWTEGQSNGLERSRLSVHVEYDGRHIFGDYVLGKLYERRRGVYAANGDEIVWTIELPVTNATPHKLCHHALYIDLLTGTGDNSDVQPGENPEIVVSYSDDGGATFGAQRFLNVGRQGQRKTRVIARRLGQSKSMGRIYRLSGSAAAAWCILGVTLEAEKLTGF